MPTASERARAEKQGWMNLAGLAAPPSEKDVVVFYDPAPDLRRRGIADDDLASLARFASGLCEAEARGWEEEDRDVATRAYEERRFLVGDRIIAWAVPWLDAVGAHEERDFLLDRGDEMRVAPILPGREGLQPAGEDSFGSLRQGIGMVDSLWSGAVTFDSPPDYLKAATKWEALAAEHPGSAQLWTDLAERARRSAGQRGTM